MVAFPDVSTLSWPVLAGVVLVAVVIVATAYYVFASRRSAAEGFGATSPGTMTQLASSHVPTEEDEEALKHAAQQAQHEADDMTRDGPPV